MTYTAPELLLVGAAQTLVLGPCGGGNVSKLQHTCEVFEAPNPNLSRADSLW